MCNYILFAMMLLMMDSYQIYWIVWSGLTWFPLMMQVDECILWLSIIFITILCTPQPTIVRWSSTPPVSDEIQLQWKGFCALIANAYYVRGMAWWDAFKHFNFCCSTSKGFYLCAFTWTLSSAYQKASSEDSSVRANGSGGMCWRAISCC